jgi:flagellar FliL protein
MANEEDLELTGNAQGRTWINKSQLIMVAGFVLVMVCSVGGTVLFLGAPAERQRTAEDPIEDYDIRLGSGKAIYHKMMPPIVTTFQSNDLQRYFQVTITLVAREQSLMVPIVTHLPMIRNKLVLLFARQDYLELQTDAGRQQLRRAATKEIQAVMMHEIDNPAVESVLFTSFVMQ